MHPPWLADPDAWHSVSLQTPTPGILITKDGIQELHGDVLATAALFQQWAFREDAFWSPRVMVMDGGIQWHWISFVHLKVTSQK